MPFGAYKVFGYGRENGIYVMEHYTQTRSVFVDLRENAPDWFCDRAPAAQSAREWSPRVNISIRAAAGSAASASACSPRRRRR
jgi:hypothetical protein